METDLAGIVKELRALDRSELKTWLRRGELLTHAKSLLVDEASFRTWLRKNGQSKTTAYRAMAAWRNFGECPSLGHFTKVALDILAQSDVARAEAIELAAKTRITPKIARELVAKHAPASPTVAIAEPRMHERVLMVGDSAIIIRTPSPRSAQDLLSLLALGARELKEEQSNDYTPPAASPLDRLRSRLAG